MNFLIIDGNSIINRAFFGIKLLTAKDGHFTNAIFGFMNIFMNLVDTTQPECIAVAFDVHAPTFRHKITDTYKAGRKPMPPELFEQMEPLKDILRAYGCHIVECPGFEADDILGTLSFHCGEHDHCYIATGDRDSLQLVGSHVSVLLTTTKMGKTQTVEYTPALLMEEYGLTPSQMIELKALQGDNSDNIPGVAGIGPKTAGELIRKYGDIDTIYTDVDALEVTENVKTKLKNGKESAYLSKQLGTIVNDAPIETDIGKYRLLPRDDEKLLSELGRHELFKLISRLGLQAGTKTQTRAAAESLASFTAGKGINELIETVGDCKTVYLHIAFENDEPAKAVFLAGGKLWLLLQPELREAIIGLASLEEIKLVTCRTKEIYKWCLAQGIAFEAFDFDIRLAAYLLDPNASDYSVSAIALSYNIGVPSVDDGVSSDEASAQLIREAVLIPGLTTRLQAILNERSQTALLKDIEIPLAKVLASMEREGMAVNRKSIEDYSVILADKVSALEKEIYELSGTVFNINSPKQLGVVLFEKMGLPARKKTKTGYSTNAEVLEELAEEHPVVAKILEFRTYSKLKSTYCDGLLKAIEADGRIRSTFNQTETRTGRLSSTEPNLQNIPVRTETGREFRKFFCAEEGCVIVDADYSQIELRVLAAIAGDRNMTDAFNAGEDIHTVTAAKVFNVPETEVTSELRSKAKAVNFGIVYGIGAFSLAKDIRSTRKEAEDFIRSYLALYTKVDSYMKNNIVLAKRDGYVSTLFNRRRYLPELTSSNGMLRAFGERVARNMPIQGTAADIIKIAMIKVYERLKKELPETKLIMQVHDELILEAPERDADKASRLLKEEMENAVSLAVRLSVDVGTGKTWYEAKG